MNQVINKRNKNERNFESLLFLKKNLNYSIFLIALEVYWKFLFKFNLNTIFSSKEREKFFSFAFFKIFFDKENWKRKFSVILIISKSISSLLETLNTYYKLKAEEDFQKDFEKKLKIKTPDNQEENKLIEKFCSKLINSVFKITLRITSFFAEFWLFFESINDRHMKKEVIKECVFVSALIFLIFLISNLIIKLTSSKVFSNPKEEIRENKVKNESLSLYEHLLDEFQNKFGKFLFSNFSYIFFSIYYFLVKSEDRITVQIFLFGSNLYSLAKEIIDSSKNIPIYLKTYFSTKKELLKRI